MLNGAQPLSLEAIGMAYSCDGLIWKRFGSHIEDWDATNVFKPTIVKLGYQMFYSRSNETQGVGKTVPYGHGIGNAFSYYGIHWYKNASNPLLSYSQDREWRAGRTYRPTVNLKKDSSFEMWFVGGRGAQAGLHQEIGYINGRFVP